MAIISFQSVFDIFLENSVVEVCAEIENLPSGGLGTDITVDFQVDSDTAGMLER